MKPLIVVNFKSYKEGSGKNALKLAKTIENVSRSCHVPAIVAVQPCDIFRVSKSVKIPVFAQHIDGNSYGSFTGSVTAESIKASSAKGTILNHAEKRISMKDIIASVKNCRKLGLKTLVCSDNMKQIKEIVKLNPDFIAFEDPKLIGTLRSVSRYNSKGVKKFSDFMKGRKPIPLCGAGIADGNDIAASKKLGTKGVLIATAVVKAKNPAAVLKEMMQAK